MFHSEDTMSEFTGLRANIAATSVLLAAARLQHLLRKANFNPAQRRIQAGQPGGGRWTIGGGRSGYPIDILEEDKLGGHTFERHVNKPDEYLKARVLGNRVNIPLLGGAGEKRAGSFTSLEAANKLVNSTLSQKPREDRRLRAGALSTVATLHVRSRRFRLADRLRGLRA
jgi:hypothetical protein